MEEDDWIKELVVWIGTLIDEGDKDVNVYLKEDALICKLVFLN